MNPGPPDPQTDTHPTKLTGLSDLVLTPALSPCTPLTPADPPPSPLQSVQLFASVLVDSAGIDYHVALAQNALQLCCERPELQDELLALLSRQTARHVQQRLGVQVGRAVTKIKHSSVSTGEGRTEGARQSPRDGATLGGGTRRHSGGHWMALRGEEEGVVL